MNNFLDDFIKSAQETVAWGLKKLDVLDPVNSLRSTELYPDPDPIYAPVEKQKEYTEILIQKRGKLLEQDHTPIPRYSEFMGRGKLVFFDENATLSDGAAEWLSKGFFDERNTPPWDTWIYYIIDYTKSYQDFFYSYLVSWVPGEFVPIADEGIKANPEGCLNWATALDLPLTRLLREKGLLL